MRHLYITTYSNPNPNNGIWVDVVLDGEIQCAFANMDDAREYCRNYTTRDEAIPEREEYGDPVYNLLSYSDTDEELGDIEIVAVWNLANEGCVLDANDTEIAFEAAEELMDDELLEEVSSAYSGHWTDDQIIFDAYAAAHKERFGEDWPPHVGKG